MDIKESIRLYKRNLLLISMIVFFYYYSGASISGVRYNGLSATFENTDALIHILWAVWLYFIVRYTQYFFTYGLPIVQKNMNETIVQKIGPLLLKISEIDYQLMPDDDYIKESVIKIKFYLVFRVIPLSNKYTFNRKPKSLNKLLLTRINLIRKKPNKLILFLKNQAAIQILHCKVTVYPVPTRDATSSAQKTIHHLDWNQMYPTFKVMIKNILVNPTFSEYVVPLIIGATPLLYFFVNSN